MKLYYRIIKQYPNMINEAMDNKNDIVRACFSTTIRVALLT